MTNRATILKCGATVAEREATEWDGSDGYELRNARSRIRHEVAVKLLEWFGYHSGQPASVVIQSGDEVKHDGSVYVWHTATVSVVDESDLTNRPT